MTDTRETRHHPLTQEERDVREINALKARVATLEAERDELKTGMSLDLQTALKLAMVNRDQANANYDKWQAAEAARGALQQADIQRWGKMFDYAEQHHGSSATDVLQFLRREMAALVRDPETET